MKAIASGCASRLFMYTVFIIAIGSLSTTTLAQAVKADHTTLDIDGFSKEELDAARALRITTDVASVGMNVNEGLDALADTNKSRYAIPNWDFRYRGNGDDPDEETRWLWKLNTFKERVDAEIDNYDIFAVKFCWVDSWYLDWETYRDTMLKLESTYPDKTFVWWTNPLWGTASGNDVRAAYNALVRDYCDKNDKPLFDIAAISSHDPDGNLIEIDGYEALYSGYTPDDGHFNDLGKQYLARGFWSLMVQLANSGVQTDTNGNSERDDESGGDRGCTSLGGQRSAGFLSLILKII